ncbi:MAG: TatD family hydrolase, partial [Pseudoalteromonas marina]
FTDTHCHLDDQVFKQHLTSLLKQCQSDNIHRIIVPSTSPIHFDEVLNLSSHNTDKLKLFPCLGIHPWFLDNLSNKDLNDLEKKVATHSNNIVAIGEAGIDTVVSKNAIANKDSVESKRSYQQSALTQNFLTESEAFAENMAKQQLFFDFQLALAKKHHLPVIVHHRQSHQIIIPMLKKHKIDKGGVIHAFSGSFEQAKEYIDLGFKIGVGGTITYPRANKTINAIKRLPLSAIVLETDAPSMPLNPELCVHHNKQNHALQTFNNSPLNVIQVFKSLVAHRKESIDEIAEQIESNVEQLFFS